jgi:hypothetical protein
MHVDIDLDWQMKNKTLVKKTDAAPDWISTETLISKISQSGACLLFSVESFQLFLLNV